MFPWIVFFDNSPLVSSLFSLSRTLISCCCTSGIALYFLSPLSFFIFISLLLFLGDFSQLYLQPFNLVFHFCPYAFNFQRLLPPSPPHFKIVFSFSWMQCLIRSFLPGASPPLHTPQLAWVSIICVRGLPWLSGNHGLAVENRGWLLASCVKARVPG